VSGLFGTIPLLAGKRILVTGAASGIGRGAAQIFEKFGFPLAAAWPLLPADRRAVLNVTDEAQCEACVTQMANTLGGSDGVFNSAGIADPVQPAFEIDIQVWQRTGQRHRANLYQHADD
jgi:NAD(P)-dependent dehydrogenase (short-subunit alcohol dehydrogenase family)